MTINSVFWVVVRAAKADSALVMIPAKQRYGCVWKCRVPLNPMVLLIIIPFLNGYFIGTNYTQHFQTNPYMLHNLALRKRRRFWSFDSPLGLQLHWLHSWNSPKFRRLRQRNFKYFRRKGELLLYQAWDTMVVASGWASRKESLRSETYRDNWDNVSGG